MPLLHLVVIALVQGITEFLPISSSAHLVLVPYVTGWQDQGLVIDVAVHVGTLLAVMIYFRRDILAMVVGVLRLVTGRGGPGARLAGMVVVASIPAFAAGLAIHEFAPTLLRSVEVIAWATLGFGILLWVADRWGALRRGVDDIGFGGAIFIGLFQALALIPGTSRSGITMTAGRLLGMTRPEAARFSLLLSVPVILGAGALAALDLAEATDPQLTGDALLAGALAFVSALAAIHVLLLWLRRAGFGPFVVYRIVLGVILLALVYGVF